MVGGLLVNQPNYILASLVDDAFTIENGNMTPTLKLKRKEIIARYATEINTVYNTLNIVYNTE